MIGSNDQIQSPRKCYIEGKTLSLERHKWEWRLCFMVTHENPLLPPVVLRNFSLTYSILPWTFSGSSLRSSCSLTFLFAHLLCQFAAFTAFLQITTQLTLVFSPPSTFWGFHGLKSECQSGSVVAQTVKNLPAGWETWVQFLGWEDPLEEDMATHSSTLAWRIPTDRGTWRATVHGVAKSWIRLNN